MSDVMTEAEFLGTDQLTGPPFIILTLTEGGHLYARADEVAAAWDMPPRPNPRGAGLVSDAVTNTVAEHRLMVNDRIYYIKETANEVMFLIQEALKAPVVFAEKEA